MQYSYNNCCIVNSCKSESKKDEIDIESLFKTNENGYIEIWKNIYYSIANKDINNALAYIFAANK
jgi:hypothetical protein